MKKEYLRKFLTLGLYVVVFFLLFQLMAVTLPYTFPFVIALVFALLMQRPMRFLTGKLRMNRSLAALLVNLLASALLILLLSLLSMWLFREIASFIGWLGSINFTETVNETIEPVITWLSQYITLDAAFVQQSISSITDLLRQGVQLVNILLSTLLNLVSSLPSMIMTALALFLSGFYFTKDLPKVQAFLVKAVDERVQGLSRKAWKDGFVLIGRFMKAFLIVNAVDVVYSLIVYIALGLPYVGVLTLITLIVDLLPFIGLIFMYIALAVWMVIEGKFVTAAVLIVAWVVINAVRQFLEPKLVSKSISVHPLAMFAALFIGIQAGNFVVMLFFMLLVFLYALLRQSGIFAEITAILSTKLDALRERRGLKG